MAKLKLHIERVPLDLVKKKITGQAAAPDKQDEQTPNSHKAGREHRTTTKNLRAR